MRDGGRVSVREPGLLPTWAMAAPGFRRSAHEECVQEECVHARAGGWPLRHYRALDTVGEDAGMIARASLGRGSIG